MKKTIIFGGGTFSYVRNHLALAAPAFGRTARRLHELIPESTLILTKMADSSSLIVDNIDLRNMLDHVVKQPETKTIIFNAAVCDFEDPEGGKSLLRFKTSEGGKNLTILPTDKLIDDIRIKRPDIFLVGFKASGGITEKEQFLRGLKMMKRSKCNLVLCNDTVTRHNFIITPEEAKYCETGNREKVLKELVEIIKLRSDLTYNTTEFTESRSYAMSDTSATFRRVMRFLIDNGGFIENNGNGFTPGHFCEKVDDKSFLSSQRRADHNKVFKEGLTLVKVKGETFEAAGRRKPSVGARSQWMMLANYPEYDCIVHTHNPLKYGSVLPVASQRPFQCGSLECGKNTLNNLKDFGKIKAVYLDKHGANLLFSSKDDPQNVIDFIKENIQLGIKVQ